ncbi:MAG: EipB family protein, partial [Methyloceanibacter sp.]
MGSPGRRVVLALALGSILGTAIHGPVQAFAAKEPSKLVPHRAVYEMKLDDARSASGVTGIDGRMV